MIVSIFPLVADDRVELAVDRGIAERFALGQADAHLVLDRGIAIVAEGGAREELAEDFVVFAARAPLDLVDVADFQVGKGNHQFLVAVVDLVIGADIAELHVARLDGHDAAVGLDDARLVEDQLLAGGIVGNVPIFAEVFDALAAIEAGDFMRDGLDRAVAFEQIAGAARHRSGRAPVPGPARAAPAIHPRAPARPSQEGTQTL